MPELPEVETTVRAIRPFENTILKKIIIHNRNLRWQVDENLEDLVANKKILTITTIVVKPKDRIQLPNHK